MVTRATAGAILGVQIGLVIYILIVIQYNNEPQLRRKGQSTNAISVEEGNSSIIKPYNESQNSRQENDSNHSEKERTQRNDTTNIAQDVFIQSLHIQGLHQDYHDLKLKMKEAESHARNLRTNTHHELNRVRQGVRENKQEIRSIESEVSKNRNYTRESEIKLHHLQQRIDYLVTVMIAWGVNYKPHTTQTRNQDTINNTSSEQ